MPRTDAVIKQQLPNVAVAQGEPIVEPDPVTDPFAGKAVVLVRLKEGGRGHSWLPICGSSVWIMLDSTPGRLWHGSGKMSNKLTKPAQEV
jgi:hypothetical protein